MLSSTDKFLLNYNWITSMAEIKTKVEEGSEGCCSCGQTAPCTAVECEFYSTCAQKHLCSGHFAERYPSLARQSISAPTIISSLVNDIGTLPYEIKDPAFVQAINLLFKVTTLKPFGGDDTKDWLSDIHKFFSTHLIRAKSVEPLLHTALALIHDTTSGATYRLQVITERLYAILVPYMVEAVALSRTCFYLHHEDRCFSSLIGMIIPATYKLVPGLQHRECVGAVKVQLASHWSKPSFIWYTYNGVRHPVTDFWSPVFVFNVETGAVLS